MFSGIWSKITIGLVIVLMTVSTGFYWYYTNTQNRIEVFQTNQARLELAVSMQEQTIERQRIFLEMHQEYSRQLQRGLAEAETARSELEEIFQSHDLDELARQRPGLIENRINRGTRDVFRQLEQETQEWYDESISR